MRKQLLSVFALLAFALVCAGSASALVQRTFVSGLGSDANDCSRAAPCRTFSAAIAQTLAGGEVLALDTAGYGPVTITKAISLISPPGVYAGITTTAIGTEAITINAGANDVVVLKGLSVTGLGLGTNGVHFNTGKALRVEGLTISGFTADGILFNPATNARLTVTDSLLRENEGAGIEAVAELGRTARIAIDRTRLIGNVFGLLANNLKATARDSVAAGNFNIGFATTDSTAVLGLENCLSTDNDVGIQSSGLVRVAGTTVTENVAGLLPVAGGSIISRGNNTVEGNATAEIFTGAFAPK